MACGMDGNLDGFLNGVVDEVGAWGFDGRCEFKSSSETVFLIAGLAK